MFSISFILGLVGLVAPLFHGQGAGVHPDGGRLGAVPLLVFLDPGTGVGLQTAQEGLFIVHSRHKLTMYSFLISN